VAKRANKLVRFIRKLKWFFTVYIWPEHDSTIMTANGLLSFSSRDRTLGRALHLDREFEFDDMMGTVNFLRDAGFVPSDTSGSTMLDIGGYIGMISIGFVRSGMFGRAIVFEPNPNNFRLTELNIEQNGLTDKITTYNIALSDRKEQLAMELSKKNFGDHRIRESTDADMEDHFDESGRKIIQVESVLLDELMFDDELSQADKICLAWMDIQGHEGRFLRGGQEFFKRNRHIPVVMEFWPYGLKRSGITRDDFCEIVEKLFSKFYILDEDPPRLRDTNYIGAYFDKYDAPDLGSHLILVNDTVNTTGQQVHQ